MRDGVGLFATVQLPAGDGPFPTILIRNPYAQFGTIMRDTLCGRFVRYGYACVLQDVRGYAREIVNRVQNTRKAAGLDVADRVVVRLAGSGDLLAAARRHEAFLLKEVLGTSLELVEDGALDGATDHEVEGAALQVAVERTEAAS